MKLTRKSEYAFLAMLYLAEHYGQGAIRSVEIAKRYSIPQDFLNQLLLTLRRAGLLKSFRGIGGGFILAKPPSEITLGQIVRLMDGMLAPVGAVSQMAYEPSPIEQHGRLMTVLRDVRDRVADIMDHTTLADLIEMPD